MCVGIWVNNLFKHTRLEQTETIQNMTTLKSDKQQAHTSMFLYVSVHMYNINYKTIEYTQTGQMLYALRNNNMPSSTVVQIAQRKTVQW